MEQQNQAGSLRDFLTVLFKHKYTILIIFVAVVTIVTVGSFLLPPTYEAKSSLLIKFGREYIYRSEVGERVSDSRPSIPLNQEEVINSEIQILTSRDLIEKVITTLKVENIYPDLVEAPPKTMTPLEAAILEFEDELSVEGVKKSNVILISFQHKDPRIAAQAVNLLVDFLKEKHLQVYSDPKSSFLEQQLSAYEQRLKESQNQLEVFKQKYRVFSLEEQRTLLLKQRTDLDTVFKIAQNQVGELQNKLSSLKNQMRTVSKDVPLYTETERYKITDDAKAQLLGLQLKEQELLHKYNEDTPLVINVRKEIKIVQNFIKEQEEDLKGKVRTGQNIVYQDIEREIIKTQAELSSQEAKSTTLGGQIARLDREIQTLDLRENELQNLKRELAANERNYKTYLEKVEEALISDDLNRLKMTNISVIQAASVPVKPIKPKKALNILLGIIIGALSGLGLAFFSEYTNQSLSTPESAEKRLGIPVLATFSYKKGG
jgi:polysaccharide biosynthesis protein PslE